MPAGVPAASTVAAALVSSNLVVTPALERGWAREICGVLAMVSELPVPTLNGVWATRNDSTAQDMVAGLEAVAQHRVPHCLEVRPACAAAAARVAGRRGLVAAAETPLMVVAGPVDAPRSDALTVHELTPEQARLHCEVAAPAFDAPVEFFAALVTPRVLALPEIRGYIGEVAGVPVATAMSVTVGHGVGLFNVATAPAHQRRGYGSAMTARAVADGLAAGASWSWLQSSEAGHGVYGALGFTTLERWPSWVTAT